MRNIINIDVSKSVYNGVSSSAAGLNEIYLIVKPTSAQKTNLRIEVTKSSGEVVTSSVLIIANDVVSYVVPFSYYSTSGTMKIRLLSNEGNSNYYNFVITKNLTSSDDLYCKYSDGNFNVYVREINKDLNVEGNLTVGGSIKQNGVPVSLEGHNHDDRYYTESEIDTKLSEKASSTHNHDDRYLSSMVSEKTYSYSTNGYSVKLTKVGRIIHGYITGSSAQTLGTASAYALVGSITDKEFYAKDTEIQYGIFNANTMGQLVVRNPSAATNPNTIVIGYTRSLVDNTTKNIPSGTTIYIKFSYVSQN